MITHERLLSELEYQPSTGIFTWRNSRSRVKAGKVAGSTNYEKYVIICVDGHPIYAHILAVFYMTGEYPKTAIDHKDHNVSNNAWGNLRVAGYSMNNANAKTRADNRLGIKGVSQVGKKYRAVCKGQYLGLFDTPEQAHQAYAQAAQAAFGEYARLA